MRASWKLALGLLLTAAALAGAWYLFPRTPEKPVASAPAPVKVSPPPSAAAPPPVDISAPPAPGLPIEVAFVEGSSLEVSDELCEKKRPPRAWLAEGATVWLYGPDGLGKGTLGKLAVDEDTTGTGICTAHAPIEGIDSRKTFIVASPNGHGALLMKEHLEAKEEGELKRWPAPLAELIRKLWFPAPGYYEKRYPIPFGKDDPNYATYARAAFVDNGTAAEAWKLDLPGSPLFFTAWKNLARAVPSGEELQWFNDSEQGWFYPDTAKIDLVTGECNEGMVRGVFDLNRDAKIELAMEVDAYEMPPYFYYCEWDGAKFTKIR